MNAKSMRNLFPILSKILLVLVGYVVVLNIHTSMVAKERPAVSGYAENRKQAEKFQLNGERFDSESRKQRLSADSLVNTNNRFHDHKSGRQSGGKPSLDEEAEGDSPKKDAEVEAKDPETLRVGGRVVNTLFDVQGKFKLAPVSEDMPIFYDEVKNIDNDRIWNQMRYIPASVVRNRSKTKNILLYNGLGADKPGPSAFTKCPVKNCNLLGDRSQVANADLVVWQNVMTMPFHSRPSGQIWAIFMLESPYHTSVPSSPALYNQINWTATYRHDSTIVTPYFKYTPFDYRKPTATPSRNFATGKTQKVAWFVSNCGARNRRLEYARELSSYIQVDIYGQCGTARCPRSNTHACFDKLKHDYKFYLAFENSNCRDYITEKFFLNALTNDILPIVMGAHPDDYLRQAPPNSFIHVDEFNSPKDLARYLHYLDKNDAAYNSYFTWKGMGFVDTNTFFWCRLCMMTHEADNPKGRHDNVHRVASWWSVQTCTNRQWGKPSKGFSRATDFSLNQNGPDGS